VDEWNQKDFIIKGKITPLTLVNDTDNVFTNRKEFRLA
jgi:hypothetical protein